MTTIQFACAACAHPLQVPTSLAGRRGTCASCKHIVQVPGATRKIVAAPARRGEASPLPSMIITGLALGGAGLLMASRLLAGA